MTIFIGGAEMGYDVELIAYMPTKDSGYLVLEKIGDEYQIHATQYIHRPRLEGMMDYKMKYEHAPKRIFVTRSERHANVVYSQWVNRTTLESLFK